MTQEEWNFAGDGCEICRKYAGWYSRRPGRPHPNCDCVIKSRECGTVHVSVSWSGAYYRPSTDEHCSGYSVTVYCDDDVIGGFSGSVCDPAGNSNLESYDQVAERITEEAEAYAEDVMDSCPPCEADDIA